MRLPHLHDAMRFHRQPRGRVPRPRRIRIDHLSRVLQGIRRDDPGFRGRSTGTSWDRGSDLEILVLATTVDRLPPGLYQYDGPEHTLRPVEIHGDGPRPLRESAPRAGSEPEELGDGRVPPVVILGIARTEKDSFGDSSGAAVHGPGIRLREMVGGLRRRAEVLGLATALIHDAEGGVLSRMEAEGTSCTLLSMHPPT